MTSQEDVTVGGVPAVETYYTLSTAAGLLPGAQLEVFTKPNFGCSITMTGAVSSRVLREAAASAVFY